jgi:PAS domain S-box-containing protein
MTTTDTKIENTLSSLKLLYDISRELAKALDLNTVLKRVLSMSLETVQGNGGSIIVIDESGEPLESAIIYNNKIYEGTTERLRATLESGLAGWVTRNREAALIKDTSKDDRWIVRKYDKDKDDGPKSTVSAPLMIRDLLVGVVTLSHPTPEHFNEEHLALVQAIADQAAIAVQNARLYESSQRRADVMEALAESAASISATLELDNVLLRILERTQRALQTEAVSLALIDHDTNKLEFKAATGGGQDTIVGLQIKMGQGVAGWVAQEGKPVIVPEARQDPRFYDKVDDITKYVTKAIAAAPIKAEGEVIGVLEALNPTTPFTEDDLAVLNGIGSIAGTAIKHANLFKEVQTAHRRFRELFEDSIDPILISDWDGKILEANRQAMRIAGFAQKTFLGMNIHHFHQVEWTVVGSDFDNLAGGETLSYESELRPLDGDPIPIEVHVHKVTIDEHDRLQWIIRDITELKNLDSLRQDLTSMIYHDLRSPLANVISGLDLISTMPPDDPSITQLIEIATRSTERVQRLVNSLLDTSRLQAGQRITALQPFSPNKLVQEAIDAVTPMATAKGYHLETKLPKTVPDVMVDPDMIRRVIINLLENALKFSPEDTTITVGAARKKDWMHISIQDEGFGIASEAQETIFEKFTRASNTRKTKGLGLGLAFCKLAVEGHNGEIWVESEENKGSTFTFTLPIAKDSS